MGQTTQGRRVNHGDGTEQEPGDYWPATSPKFAGYWTVVAPNGQPGMLNPAVHTIEEHEDGTITVHPSIVYSDAEGRETWHGWLRRGVFEEC